MTTNRKLRISRLGLAALAVLSYGTAFGQLKQTTYSVTIVGPANSSRLPSLGIDAAGRVAGMCYYVENGQTETRAWTYDPALGYLLSPSEYSTINGVSADGVLVGSSYGSPTVFDWLGNPTLILPTTSGCFMAVNQSLDIAGYINDPWNNWVQTAVVFDRNGNMSRLGSIDLTSSAAYGINEDGVAVGYATDNTGETRAFVWRNGMEFLPGLSGNSDVAISINNWQNIVGYTITPTDQVLPVRWSLTPMNSRQVIVDLPIGFTEGLAQCINDNGQMVGTMWNDQGDESRAFVTRSDGTIVDLNELKTANGRVYTLISANAINANGDIAGIAIMRIHPRTMPVTLAYVARPVPLPLGVRP